MSKPKPKDKAPTLIIDSQVIQQMRQHARSQLRAEVCGVLIGSNDVGAIHVQASIEGVNAAQAGTHVTFTQDTWEHVYQIKDKQYPTARILGWYHSHPGFGVFLSDHDTFIHKNFFSSPDQVAWVYDPHSDEEGCFGWVGDRLERIAAIEVHDVRGGEQVDSNPALKPSVVEIDPVDEPLIRIRPQSSKFANSGDNEPVWVRVVFTVISHLAALLLGLFIAWFVFPRVLAVPVPVDPVTGHLLDKFMRPDPSARQTPPQAPNGLAPNAAPANQQQSSEPAEKGSDGNRK